MSKAKNGSSAKSEQIVKDQTVTAPEVAAEVIAPAVEDAEVVEGEDVTPDAPAADAPAADAPANEPAPLPAFIIAMNEARAKQDAENAAKLAELQAAFKTAKIAYFTANQAADFEQTPEVIAAGETMKAADDAIVAFNKELAALVLERTEEDSKNVAKNDLCIKFGIEIDVLNRLIEASKDEKDTLKSSFQIVFGKPTIFAKPGTKGIDLSKPASGNGQVSDKADNSAGGTKTAEAEADLKTMTHEQLLAKYPTERKDGTIDYGFLNGTVRGLINKLKLKKNAEGFYVPRETAAA